jgi:hypothetical protein
LVLVVVVVTTIQVDQLFQVHQEQAVKEHQVVMLLALTQKAQAVVVQMLLVQTVDC